jgi:hydrogenase nickel incorporation protein HypA/HybF
MSIARDIVEIVEEAVRDEPAARVERVVVRVGAMVSVVPDSLSFCYEAITDGTPLAGSRLVVDEVPVRVCCNTCHYTGGLKGFVFRCERCGGTALSVLSGSELIVAHIEVDE